MPFVDLPGPNNLVMGVLDELVPMRKPSRKPGQREQHCEVLSRYSYRLVNNARVEVNVRVQLAAYKIIVRQCNSFQFDGDIHQLLFSCHCKNLFGYLFDQLGARIVIFVDSMPESHENALFILNSGNERRDVFQCANLF